LAISLAAIALLAACGGASGPDNDAPGDNNRKDINDQDESQIKQVYAPSAQLANTCVTPASGEKQGTVNDEKSWVRSFVDERYLWYKDVPYVDASKYTSAAAYFEVLKTPAKNSMGKDLDRFHWSESIEETNRYNSGVSLDYGIKWVYNQSSPPRDWVVYDVEPQSPAGKAGIQRGDKLLTIDGLDFKTSAEVGTINSALFPKDKAEHQFVFSRAGTDKSFRMSAGESYETEPVRYSKVVDHQGKKVAYLFFNSFIAKTQDPLIEAFKLFDEQDAEELVLDLRYNGGGLLYLSSQLAYMIAGEKSLEKIYSQDVYNDKRTKETADSVIQFIPVYIDWAKRQIDRSRPLPTLNLKRVTILASARTASASEAVINGLRGIDVDVTLIGKPTVGKPYGFTPQPNCGRTYYAVEFKGANAKGFSDYDAGFAPTCTVDDDLSHALGDPLEANFASALHYLANKKCNTSSVSRLASIQKPEPIYDSQPPRMIVTPIRIK